MRGLTRRFTPLLAAAALAAASIPANAIYAAPTAEERIVYAIGVLDGDAERFTKSGKPRVKALEALLDADASGAERDAAWATYKAMQDGGASGGGGEAVPDPAVVKELAALKDDYSRLEQTMLDEREAARMAEANLRASRSARDRLQRQVNAKEDELKALSKEVQAARGGEIPCVVQRIRLEAKINEWFADGWREDAGALVRCLE